MIDKTDSRLIDIMDVDVTQGVGDVLKYKRIDEDEDGVFEFQGWTLGTDETGAGDGEIDGDSILPGSITESSIRENANIQQTKFNNLTNQLSSKLQTSGGVLAGDLDMASNEITGISQINGVPLQPFFDKTLQLDNLIITKEDALPNNETGDSKFYNENKTLLLLNTDGFPEGLNHLYYSDENVFSTKLNIPAAADPPDTSEVVTGNTVGQAIQKMESQILTGSVPPGSLSGDNLENGSVTLDKLFKEHYLSWYCECISS